MKNNLQDLGADSKTELIDRGRIIECNTKSKQVRFRLSIAEYTQLQALKDNFKLDTISQAIRHMIKRWYEIEEKTIIERQRLAEEAAKIGARIV